MTIEVSPDSNLDIDSLGLLKFGILTMGAVIYLAFLNLVYSNYLDWQITRQAYRNNYLQNKLIDYNRNINEIEGIIKKRGILLSRIDRLHQIQLSSHNLAQTISEVAHVLPKGIRLTELSAEHGHLHIKGSAKSPAIIARLRRNLEGSRWQSNSGKWKLSDKRRPQAFEFFLVRENKEGSAEK